MEETNEGNEHCIKSWETYKILNKMKESVQQKRRIAKDVAAQQSVDTHGNQITIEKRLNATKEQLNDLLCDGKELITNIKTANERREASRRLQEDQQRAHLLADLQQESEESTKKLNAINSRWSELAEISDPMDLNERLRYQNQLIAQLMQQKDRIIIELQEILNNGSRIYNTDQLKQQGDIQSLIERIDEQIDVMKLDYLEHLELLHHSIDSERRTFKLYHSNKWQMLFVERTSDGEQYLCDLLDRKEKFYDEITATRLNYEEINREMRIQLDKDNNLVQQKLQRAKAESELNMEQLNYNYYVLQKRAAENINVRNKQKNRLIKMRTCISMLRKKINTARMTQTIDIERQTHYVLNLYANIKELEHKMSTFSESGYQKFQHIWQLYESNADSKLNDIMQIDRILHEKHLGFRWKQFICKKSSKQNQLQPIQSVVEAKKSSCIDDFHSIKKKLDDVSTRFNFSELFFTIGEQISSQTNWMLGDKLTKFLDLIEDHKQKRIITIDNILTALGVTNLESAHLLKNYFLPYASCITCSRKFNEITTIGEETSDQCAEHEITNFFVDQHMIPIIMQQFLIDLDGRAPSKMIVKHLSHDEDSNALYSIDANEIELFWKDYMRTIPNELELIWDTIVNGLLRYLQILKRRRKQMYECNFLRQQNTEISYLLQQYSNTNRCAIISDSVMS
ncbi:dynein regulatory complex protein 1 homolog [Sitodiplosis mosellana]|uniref:dynein regulatory complex protein 1 homolog n=1 Tax=Sitodiplosis mosellana TaxID=263140 RepID=UPI0024448861|nr:dynein regulatory complex protein 1 homolog [Sitodiplosis mosellana]